MEMKEARRLLGVELVSCNSNNGLVVVRCQLLMVCCCSNNGLLTMVRRELLLVSCNSNNGLLIVARCELLLVSCNSNNGLLIVARCELLLVSCNSNNDLSSFLFEHIKVDFHLLAVLVKTAHLDAHGRDCDVWGNDCLCSHRPGKMVSSIDLLLVVR
ncbi:unnamed protein product [Prunus armeniaca]